MTVIIIIILMMIIIINIIILCASSKPAKRCKILDLWPLILQRRIPYIGF